MTGEEEIRVFQSFTRTAGLKVIPNSLEKRQPPEPDILCLFEDGSAVAFELVEICHPHNARWIGSAPSIGRALEETYHALPTELRHRFTYRFANRPLSFTFTQDTSLNRIRRILARAFAELLEQPEENGLFATFSTDVRKNTATRSRAG